MKRILTIAAIVLSALAAQAQDFSGTLTVTPNWQASTTSGAAVVKLSLYTLLSQSHTYGTNHNQMQSLILRSGTLTNGESVTLNLADVTNGFGQAVNLSRINFIAIRSPTNNAMIGTGTNAAMTGTNCLVIGNAASDQLAAGLFGGTNQTQTVLPGGMWMVTAPIMGGIVSTGKLLKIANVGDTNSMLYEAYIGGI